MRKEGDNFMDKKKNGLSQKEVQKRIEKGLVNFDTAPKTKSTKQIIRENAVTLFNIINLILAVAVILVGSYKNVTFIGIIILNTLISTFQELRSKKTIDKLSVISSTKVHVVRDGKEEEIGINEIVLDDLIHLRLGNQIVTDSTIIEGNVEVDESFITGESEPLYKKKGDTLLSGSFIVSGSCYAQVIHIGHDNYTAKISSDTKYIKPISSEIMRSLNKIVGTISCAIVPIGILFFSRQLFLENNTIQNAVVNTVAALIGMIPEGLVLLTSTVLAVSVLRLSKQKVLVQDLYCIETLARVDTICLDKTGTITEGIMEVADMICLDKTKENELKAILGKIMAKSEDNNPTSKAIKDAFYDCHTEEIVTSIPFSSEKKYSGATFSNGKTYLLGAPEFLLENHGMKYEKELQKYTQEYRVVALVETDKKMTGKETVRAENALCFLLIRDKIRKEAKDTLSFFKEQGVTVKIISGDNKDTVLNIARRAGVGEDLKAIDLSTLKKEEEIEKAALEYDVFGRVKPEQKHMLIKALKQAGHTVAMTGDGVNDCLALKEADCSVAMASGSDAARSVSQLVLLDSNFASMPHVVAEGRRTINNIERSASLFLVKTVYATILAVLFLFIESPYPFIPIQLTLASVVTIGIPSFVLALEPNHDLVRGHFLTNVLKKAIPPAIVIVINILLITLASSTFQLSYAKTSTLSLTLTGYTSFILLYRICQPFNRVRFLLFILMFYGFLYGMFNLTSIFSITHFDYLMIAISFMLMFVSHQLYNLFTDFLSFLIEKKEERKEKVIFSK